MEHPHLMACARCKRFDVPLGAWESPPYTGQQLCADCKLAETIARKHHRDTVIRTLVEHAPAEMDEAGFGKRRCVLATRVAIETLKRFNIEAEPLIVDVFAANASWLRVAQNKNATEADFLATDAHLIRMNTDDLNTGGFPAHLVARLIEYDSILDLDAQQFRRPGINTPSAGSFFVHKDFLAGTKTVEYDLPGGGVIAYQVLNDGVERNFREGADWKHKAAWFPLVRNLTLRVEAALKGIKP
jgi:hypothetical protein